MANTNNKTEIFNQASEVVKEIYAGEATGVLLRRAADSVGIITSSDYKTFVLIVGDIILGLHKPESLKVALKDSLNLPEEKLVAVEKQLATFFKTLPTTNENVPSVIEIPPVGTPVTPAEIQTAPAEEKPDGAVKPLRTFAMDVDISRAHSYGSFQSEENNETNDDEPVHRSSQDDILKK